MFPDQDRQQQRSKTIKDNKMYKSQCKYHIVFWQLLTENHLH